VTDVNRQIVLRERPRAAVGPEHFELRESPVPEPGPGQFLIRVLWLSFDPTQRGWLNDVESYVPPVAIGEVMRAGAVGQVVASNNQRFTVGEFVQGTFGWQDYVVTDGRGMLPVTKVPAGVTPRAMLGVFGITGLTAYFGMLDVAKVLEGDVVFVSGAAGATGSVAGQIARIRGARVIGSAGGADKCAWVRDVAGFDEVVDYRSEDVSARLGSFAPNGLNVYFDNVGGPTLEAALDHLALGARIALCGGISSGYTAEALPPGPRNYMQLVIRRATMTGFLVLDYVPRFGEAVAQLSQWVADGRIRYAEDIVEGLEHAPSTLNRLFEGRNLGKQLLKVADAPLG
jgi:NADPH-dependent curcumin reductase CurA